MNATTRTPLAHAPGGVVNVRGASLRAVYIIWYRDLLRFSRDRLRVVGSLAQPLLFLVVFGTGLSRSLGGAGNLGSSGTTAGGIDYVQFMFPGIVAMAVLFASVFGAMSIVWDREFGFLKEVLVAPVNRSAVAIGKTLGSATQAMLQGMILLVAAPFADVHLSLRAVLELVPLTFAMAFSLSAFGVALASKMHSMQGFQVVMNFLLMPMFFLSGALFPLQGLPAWMTVLTRANPVAYGVDPIRRAVLDGAGVPHVVVDQLSLTWNGSVPPILVEVAVLLAFGFAMLALAVRGFRVQD